MSTFDTVLLWIVKIAGVGALLIVLWYIGVELFEWVLNRTILHTEFWRTCLEYMWDQKRHRVPLYCPKCGKEVKGRVLGGRIKPDPTLPSLECMACKEEWRVVLRSTRPVNVPDGTRWCDVDMEPHEALARAWAEAHCETWDPIPLWARTGKLSEARSTLEVLEREGYTLARTSQEGGC